MKHHPILASLVAAAAGCLICAQSFAAPTYYNTRAAFDAANPFLPIEGFENGSSPNTSLRFTGPLNSSTNNSLYSPGDILPGISLEDDPGPGPDGLFQAAPGQSTNLTTAIGSREPSSDALDLLFGPGVSAVAFDIFQNFGGGSQSGTVQPYTVSVFGTSGLLGSTVVNVAPSNLGFFGVQDLSDLIVRVSVQGPSGAYEVIDNVAFGTVVPEPASMALFGLTALGMGVIVRRRRRNAEPTGQTQSA